MPNHNASGIGARPIADMGAYRSQQRWRSVEGHRRRGDGGGKIRRTILLEWASQVRNFSSR